MNIDIPISNQKLTKRPDGFGLRLTIIDYGVHQDGFVGGRELAIRTDMRTLVVRHGTEPWLKCDAGDGRFEIGVAQRGAGGVDFRIGVTAWLQQGNGSCQ
jgi:hypothetical protein